MPNEHVRRTIDAYLDPRFLPVPHAILLSGAWGSGKTFFLKEIYEPERQRRKRKLSQHHTPFLFVSLFGATSAADVELRIYKAANPGEAVVGAVAGTIALGIGEFFQVRDATKGAVDKFGKRAIKRLNNYTFVFDDLERVEPEAFLEIMGLVNRFVADHGKRVILVADEDAIKNTKQMKETWREQSEKIVGRRAKIEPDIARTLQITLEEVPASPSTKFAQEIAHELTSISRSSGVKNLRSLKWALHNAVALSESLANDPDIPRSHIEQTIKVVVASTLWLRSNLVDKESLHLVPGIEEDLLYRKLSSSHDEPLDPLRTKADSFRKAFTNLNVQQPPVKFEYITELEETGAHDAEALLTWVKSQFGFGSGYQEPAWRRLWHEYSRTIAEADDAVNELSSQLSDLYLHELGEILHAIGLSLRHEKHSDLRLTGGNSTKEFFYCYIDKLFAERRLPSLPTNDYSPHYESHEGLGFAESKSPEFLEIANYLFQRCNEAYEASLLRRAEQVLAKASLGEAGALTAFIHVDDALGTAPILHKLDPERFGEIVTIDMPQLRDGARVLAYRYHQKHRGDPILSELTWARKAYASVVRRLSEWDHPYDKLGLDFLERHIRYYEKDRDADLRILEES